MGLTVSTVVNYLSWQEDLFQEFPTYFLSFLAGTVGIISVLYLTKVYASSSFGIQRQLQQRLSSAESDVAESPTDTTAAEEVAFDTSNPSKRVPVSVNFHFTRVCNYACGFCFHTAKTSHLTPLEEAKRGLQMLANKGMKKLNLSGGEPFTQAKYVGELCKFSKQVLQLESVSIVSNGSKIRKDFFTIYGEYLDILAISVDSFDEETNIKIGRGK